MTSAAPGTANLFVLHGKGHFTDQDPRQTLSFTGEEITIEPVAIGTLVTVRGSGRSGTASQVEF